MRAFYIFALLKISKHEKQLLTFNPFLSTKVVTFRCAYFSKLECKTSEAMEKTAKVDFVSNLQDFERTKNIAKEYAVFNKLYI